MTDIESHLGHLPTPSFVSELSKALGERAAGLAPTTVSPGPRLGVIADTHCARAEDLPVDVLEAFREVDLIVHCGDIGTVDVLDRLGGLAPVLAVRSGGDAPADGEVLFEGPRLVRAGHLLVGVVSHLDLTTREEAVAIFGADLDLILTGTTHVPEIVRLEDLTGHTTVVNPGSPTLPFEGDPTVAVINTAARAFEAQIVNIRTSKGDS